MPAHAHDQPKPITGAAALAARRERNRQRMRVALAINAAMLALALAGGLVFDSLALLADAGHVLSDFGAIALGLLAAGLAARGGAPRRTFGLHRGEVLAALVNGIGLVAIAVLVAIAAIGRLEDPPEIEGAGVLVVGLFGLAGNVWATWVLAGGERSDLNLEAVLRHSAADALGSLAVVFSAVAIMVFSWHEADPVAGLAIAALILASSARLVRDPLDVLMESAPVGLDVDELGTRLCAVEGVSAIHELHVWTVTSGFDALAAHVVTAAGVDRDGVRRELELLLRDAYGIEHTTLQMEEPGDEDALLQVHLQDS